MENEFELKPELCKPSTTHIIKKIKRNNVIQGSQTKYLMRTQTKSEWSTRT